MRRPLRHIRFCLEKYLLALFLCWLGETAFALEETSPYISQSWQTEEGLPHNAVRAIAQTEDRYLWIATDEGLARFDGVRFQNIAPFGRDEHSITALSRNPRGTLFTGTDQGKIFERAGELHERVLPLNIGHDAISALLETGDGSLWIGTSANGVFRAQNGTLTHWMQKDGLAHNSVRAFCEDSDHQIWIATSVGLSRWRDGKLDTITVKEGLLHNSTRALCADRAGNLWIGSHFGLTRLKDGKFSHFTKSDGLCDNIITAILEDHEGQIWIGTFNGLNRLSGGKIVTEVRNDGGSYDRVNCIFQDQENNIWVGSKDGLIRLKPRRVTTLSTHNGLSSNSATSIFEAKDGSIWIGTWGGGVNKLLGDKISVFGRRDNLSSDFVLAVHQSRRGYMWFGMDYDGGIEIQQRTNHFIHYREGEGLHDHVVRALQDDVHTNLWIGTSTALLSFRDGKFHRYTTEDGLPSNSIQTLYEDSANDLWVGTANGLSRFGNGTFTNFSTRDGLSHNVISTIFEDSNRTLWIGTLGGGLNRLRSGKFTAFTTAQGLLDDDIHGVQEDDFGRLWMSSSRGIFFVAKEALENFNARTGTRLTCTAFDKSDGMLSVNCKGTGRTAACKTRDGRLWFPTGKGVAIVDPKCVTINPEPPLVSIEEFRVDDQECAHFEPREFVAGKQDFTFRYSAPGFSGPEKMQFRYKLEGLDDDWQDGDIRREAHYAHLPSGHFTFRVLASNSDGVWNEKGASLSFSLVPPFYKTGWFLMLAGVISLSAVGGMVRYASVRKFQAQLRRAEQAHAIERERARIAQNMHDELGARLTEILLLNEMAQKQSAPEVPRSLEKMSRTIRDVVRNLDAMVWAVNPENDSLEKLVGYIQEYAQMYLETAAIRCWFDFPETLPDCALAADTRHNFFSAVKEALHNVVKHSRATEVRLALNLRDGAIFFSIADNGNGFSREAVSQFGNGLKNMKRRIEAVGGQFDLQSELGKGTKICFQFPLKSLKHDRDRAD